MRMFFEWEGIWKEAFVPIPSFTRRSCWGKSENSASISGFGIGKGTDYLSHFSWLCSCLVYDVRFAPVTMTLVFSMECRVLVPLPDYTESCKKAAVFIWLPSLSLSLSLFFSLGGALSRVLTSACIVVKFCLSVLSSRPRFQFWNSWMDLD